MISPRAPTHFHCWVRKFSLHLSLPQRLNSESAPSWNCLIMYEMNAASLDLRNIAKNGRCVLMGASELFASPGTKTTEAAVFLEICLSVVIKASHVLWIFSSRKHFLNTTAIARQKQAKNGSQIFQVRIWCSSWIFRRYGWCSPSEFSICITKRPARDYQPGWNTRHSLSSPVFSVSTLPQWIHWLRIQRRKFRTNGLNSLVYWTGCACSFSQ